MREDGMKTHEPRLIAGEKAHTEKYKRTFVD